VAYWCRFSFHGRCSSSVLKFPSRLIQILSTVYRMMNSDAGPEQTTAATATSATAMTNSVKTSRLPRSAMLHPALKRVFRRPGGNLFSAHGAAGEKTPQLFSGKVFRPVLILGGISE